MSISKIQAKMMNNILKTNTKDMDVNNFRKEKKNKLSNSQKKSGYDTNDKNKKNLKNSKISKLPEFSTNSKMLGDMEEYNFELSEPKLNSFISSERTDKIDDKINFQKNLINSFPKREGSMSLTISPYEQNKTQSSLLTKNKNNESIKNKTRNTANINKNKSIDGDIVSLDSITTIGLVMDDKKLEKVSEIEKKLNKIELIDNNYYEGEKKFKGINISLHKQNSIEILTINKLNLDQIETSNNEENEEECSEPYINQSHDSPIHEKIDKSIANNKDFGRIQEFNLNLNLNDDYNENYDQIDGVSILEELDEEFPKIMKKLTDGIKDEGGKIVFDTSKNLHFRNGLSYNSQTDEIDSEISNLKIQPVKISNPKANIKNSEIKPPIKNNFSKLSKSKSSKNSLISKGNLYSSEKNNESENVMTPLVNENGPSKMTKAVSQSTFSKNSGSKFNNNLNSINNYTIKSTKDYSVHNIQKLSYEVNKEYSHFKAPNDQNFMKRMDFYTLKKQVKDLKMKEMVKSRKSKITEKEKLDTFNHLIEDANRRLEAQKKIESLNSNPENYQKFNPSIAIAYDENSTNNYNDPGVHKKYCSKTKVSVEEWDNIYKERFESKLIRKNERIDEEKIKKEIKAKEEEEKIIEQIKANTKKADQNTIDTTVKRLYSESERRQIKTDSNNSKSVIRPQVNIRLYDTGTANLSSPRLDFTQDIDEKAIHNFLSNSKKNYINYDFNANNYNLNDQNNLNQTKDTKDLINSPKIREKFNSKNKKRKYSHIRSRYNSHDAKGSIKNTNASRSRAATGHISPSNNYCSARTKSQSKSSLPYVNSNNEIVIVDVDPIGQTSNFTSNQPIKGTIVSHQVLTDSQNKPKKRKSNSIYANKSYQSNIDFIQNDKEYINNSPIKVKDLTSRIQNSLLALNDTGKSTINTQNGQQNNKKQSYVPEYKASLLVSNILNKINGI